MNEPALAFLMVPYAAAILFVIADLRGTFARTPVRTPPLASSAWAAIVAALYLAQIAVSWWAATHQLDPRLPYGWLPLPVIDMRSSPHDLLSAAVVAIGAAQAYALLGLYRSAPSRRVVVAGFIVMAVMSVASPSLASFDPYGYVHNALLGPLAYTPPLTAFPGEYHVIDLWFGQPTSTLYGPLWLPIVRMITIAAPSLFAKLIALRCANLLFFIALLALIRATGLPRRYLAIAALNPALLFQYVSNAHNDVIAVVVLMMAVAIVPQRQVLAGALVAVAGLVKLPFAILGLPLFSNVAPLYRRLLLCAAAVAATVAFSWLGAGEPYLRALAHFGVHAGPWRYWHLPALVLAVALLCCAIFSNRRYRSAVWILPTVGAFGIPIVYPWYFLWGLIYAMRRRRVLRHILLGFPLAAALVQHEFWSPITILVVFPILTAVLCLSLTPRAKASAA
jgi:hypothetical protein